MSRRSGSFRYPLSFRGRGDRYATFDNNLDPDASVDTSTGGSEASNADSEASTQLPTELFTSCSLAQLRLDISTPQRTSSWKRYGGGGGGRGRDDGGGEIEISMIGACKPASDPAVSLRYVKQSESRSNAATPREILRTSTLLFSKAEGEQTIELFGGLISVSVDKLLMAIHEAVAKQTGSDTDHTVRRGGACSSATASPALG